AEVRVRASRDPRPVVAHAGFVHFEGNGALLRALASVLNDMGGHLDLYTTHSVERLARYGLVPPLARLVGYFPAAEMADRIAASAHALVVTASFEPKDRVHESTLFPSKLADYTAIGLP